MTNLQRMLNLVEEAFYSGNGSDGQITVNDTERLHLQAISRYCLNEYEDDCGPVIWLLLVPTTYGLMNEFVYGRINEVSLLMQTPIGIQYNALYLCSAITLPEYRNKGLTSVFAVKTIENIRKEHAIASLFYWPFSATGEKLAKNIASAVDLPLYERMRK